MSPSYNGTVVESRVDWLTMSASGTQERLDLAALAESIVRSQQDAGDDVRPWAHQGYSGFATQHAQWGQRPDTDLLRLSGALADERLAEVLPYASNVSRIDTCVTVRLPDADHDIIREGYDSGRNATFQRGHKPALQLLEHSTKGSTLYLGSRASRSFGRLYNKHRESELAYYADCFRYEVEQKANLANARARLLATDSDRRATIVRDVHAYFSERGIAPRFAPGDGHLPSPPYRAHSDDQRRLLWLSQQVRAVVDTLSHHGLRDQALFALGLDESHRPLDKLAPLAYIGLAGHEGAETARSEVEGWKQVTNTGL